MALQGVFSAIYPKNTHFIFNIKGLYSFIEVPSDFSMQPHRNSGCSLSVFLLYENRKKAAFTGTRTMVKIFIDGEHGTIGLQIRNRLGRRTNLEILSLPRKLSAATRICGQATCA